MALLMGFALDQQVTVQKAFSGPLALRERLGSLDAATLAEADLERGLPREAGDPPLPRLDGQARPRARRPRARRYDGDACRVWNEAADAADLRAEPRRAAGLRGDEGQVARRGAGQALRRQGRRGPRAAHPTLGDVDSPQALAAYQAAKKAHKTEWSKMRAGD